MISNDKLVLTLFGISEATFMSGEESDPRTGVRLGVQLFFLDQPLHTFFQFIYFGLEHLRHKFK